MSFKRLFLLFVVMFILSGPDLLHAQDSILNRRNYNERYNKVQRLPERTERLEAIEFARNRGMITRKVGRDGSIREIRRLNVFGMPEYLQTMNMDAARTLRTDSLWTGGGLGLELSGSGLAVGIWDGGVLRSTHQEFGDRARIMNPQADVSGHGTHVSGTIGASGVESNARGMAGSVILESYDWNSDLDEMEAAAADGLLVSNHSYGYLAGFDYDSDEEQWYWWGDPTISEDEDYTFGFYHIEARDYDQIAHDYPNYLIVKAAGNDRAEGPEPGTEHQAWYNGDWTSSTYKRPVDGGEDGFDCITPVSTAKNILTVGSALDLTGEITSIDDIVLSSFSSFGPTDDGRIKPDILGNGHGLYSSYSGGDADYQRVWGTSMATPNVSGSLLLLQEHWHQLNGYYMRAATLKGLVLHTATDAVRPGPDYESGWGLMNSAAAASLLSDTLFNQVQELSLENGGEVRLRMVSDGLRELRATICWTDVPGDVPDDALDPGDRILVNDLDLRITRISDLSEYKPWVLDPLQPELDAGTGDNVLDNVEQVRIGKPARGFYEIVITHKGSLDGGAQDFSLILSGLSTDFYASGETILTDNNGAFILTTANEYLPNTDASWLIQPENGRSPSLYFSAFETEADNDVLRIYDGINDQAPLLAELSGNMDIADSLVLASGQALWVHFTSDALNQAAGFDARYCTVAPEGDFTLHGESYPCVGGEELYAASGQEGTDYNWIIPAGWTKVDSSANQITLIAGQGMVSLEALPYNRCGSSLPAGLSLQTLEAVPALSVYSGDTVICSGASGELEVDSLLGARYTWSLPQGWIGSSDVYRLGFSPSVAGNSVSVSAENACGSGSALSIPIEVETVPPTARINALSGILCPESKEDFYLPSYEGTMYTWSVESDWKILGQNTGDTVLVLMGRRNSSFSVSAENHCGTRVIQASFNLLDAPETPLLSRSGSAYASYDEIMLQNASDFRAISWYLDGQAIESEDAQRESIVAYVPGIYTVEVSNSDGCSYLQDESEGLDTRSEDNIFAVYASGQGQFTVVNASNGSAEMRIFDLQGRLQLIQNIVPGDNIFTSSLLGVYLVRIEGISTSLHSKILLY